MPRYFFQVLHKSNTSNLKYLPLHCKREGKIRVPNVDWKL